MAINPTAASSLAVTTHAPEPSRKTESVSPEITPPKPDHSPAPARALPAKASLWELLTTEERAVLEKQAVQGSLTYGNRGKAAARLPVPTGQRIDFRG